MSRILLGVFLSVAVALTAMAPAPALAQPRCSERLYSATGAPGRILYTAHRNARVLWSAKVRAELGTTYAKWGRAADRNYDCKFSNWKYHCSAEARPCRPLASSQ